MTINDPIIETEMQDQLEKACNEVNQKFHIWSGPGNSGKSQYNTSKCTCDTCEEADPNLIGFNNGVYDLRTDEFRDQRPEDCISLTTGNDFIEFDPNSELINTVYHFMKQLFPDPDLCNYVLTLFASFLDGHNPHNKFHILTGLGASGISTLLELFELAFGKYITHLHSTIFTQKKHGPLSTNLKNKRVVLIQERETSETFSSGVIKELCGNDTIICQSRGQQPIYFRPQFKLLYSCNSLPRLPGNDEGIWHRVDVIELKSRFVDNPDPKNPYEFKKDVYLGQKLITWKEAFMFILLEHYKIYKKQGLIEPMAVKNAIAEYRRKNDIYIQFIDDCLEKDPNCSIKLEPTYQIFKAWWKENFDGKVPCRMDMKTSMERKLGHYLPNSDGGWHGYKLVVGSK